MMHGLWRIKNVRGASRVPVASPAASEPLGAAVVRAARNARWQVLLECTAIGLLGLPVAWLVPSHRVILVLLAVVFGAFGVGGLSDRILRDEHATADPDRVLLVGFAIVRGISVAAGTSAAIAVAMWLLFAALGLNWH
jgi:hypothetical protein